MDRKQIVKILDRAAARCSNGATAKQTWYLAGLMQQEFAGDADRLENELSDFVLGAALDRGLASAMIDGTLNALKAAA